MEKIISRLDLCELIKMPYGTLRKYIQRKDIIESKKGFIDIYDEKNNECIINYASKKGIDLDTIYVKEQEEVTEYEEVREEQETKSTKRKKTYAQLRDEKLSREVEKLTVETRLKNLELEKKKDRVLPLDIVIEWSARNMRGVFGETTNFGNSIIEQMCNELNADTEIKLKYKKLFKMGFNDVLKNGIKNQEPESLSYAKEYSLNTKW
jgi:hypothetical protein